MSDQGFIKVSVVIPARNEAQALAHLLDALREGQPRAELIVVDDGSTDETARVARDHGARVIVHPYSMGNGAAIKTGARHARGAVLVFMDADGQHDPADVPRLLAKLDEGYEMVVGARNGASQANIGRSVANRFYNRFATYMTGHQIADLTSGFRAARANRIHEFLYLLPNGFSYPTTITMAFFRIGFPVAYIPITAARREGKSHIAPLKDGIRFLLIIFKVGVLYSPLKVFLPVSAAFFALGLLHYVQTFISDARFTNMSALLLSISVLIFVIGLVSEQITQLTYRPLAGPHDEGASRR